MKIVLKNYKKLILAGFTLVLLASLAFALYFLYQKGKENQSGIKLAPASPELIVPLELQFQDETMALNWSDENQGENLIIQSDRKYYSGSGQTEVFFTITNTTEKEQTVDIIFWFDKADKKVEKVEKIENGKISSTKFLISQLSNEAGENLNLNFRERKKVNGYNTGSKFEDKILSGKTNSYKAIIKFPADQKQTEFFIEGFGRAPGSKLVIGYGHLDPYLTGGLVGYWSLNGADIDWKTQTAYDRSGEGNNGTITNMSTTTSPTRGVSGQALKFDGVDDTVNMGDPADGSLDFGTSNFSVSAWVYTETKDTAENLYEFVGKWSWSETINGYDLGTYAGKYTVHLGNGLFPSACWIIWYNGDAMFSANDLVAGKWEQVVVTFDRTGFARMYVNGVLSNSKDISSFSACSISNSDDFLIGARDDGTGAWFSNSSVDEVRVYNRLLSADEVSDLYRKESARTKITASQEGRWTNGLVGYWPLDGEDLDWGSNTAYDRSGNNRNGTMVNLSTSTSPIPGKIGQALKFSGDTDYIGLSSPLTNINTFSTSLWIKTATTSENAIFFSTTNGNNGWAVAMDRAYSNCTDGKICVWLYNGVTGGDYAVHTYDFPVDIWTHWVVTYSITSGAINMYINGAIASSSIISYYPDTSSSAESSINRGSSGWSPSDMYLNGGIDDVRVYNRVLSSAEVSEIYNASAASHAMKIDASQVNRYTKDLIGMWSFDGKDINWGTNTAYDRSSPNNNGVITNLSTSTSPTIGKVGQALNFDGSDDYINVPYNAVYNVTTGLTLAAWVYLDNTATDQYIIARRSDTIAAPNQGNLYRIAYYGTAGNIFAFNIFNGTNWTDCTTSGYTTKGWYFVVGTFDGTNERIYVNGSLAGGPTNNAGSIPSSTYGVHIGDFPVDGTNKFDGLIDEARVYSRALSASEVLELYNATSRKVKINR